jgi:hypothetical protein
MIVEISPKDGHLQARKMKDGSEIFSQRAYLHTNAPFPVPFKLSLDGPVPNAAGKYELDPACFKAGQYGDLEIDRYGIKLLKIAG